MLFHRVRQNALLPSTVPTSHFLTNWLWGFYDWCTYRKNHFCQASSVTCPWDMTSPLPRIALSNQIFPGQCKLWQIPSSCIMRFPANLPNSRESGRVSWFQLRGMLSDWMMLKPQPSTAVISPFQLRPPRLLCLFIFWLLSVGLVSTRALTTWPKKQLRQSRTLPGNPPVTVTKEANVCVWMTVVG